MDLYDGRAFGRRAVLLVLGQIGVGVALSACAPSRPDATPTPPSNTSAAPVGSPAPAASLGPAQSPVVAPASSPAGSPGASPAVSPAASPAASQQGPVSGAAPLPARAPTPGGPPPTVVGTSSGPAPQPNAAGAFVVEGGASPVASPGIAVSPAASPAAASGTPQPAAMVSITADRKFDPAQVTIGRGQLVLWRNISRSPQTVTFDPRLVSNANNVALPSGAQAFDSGVINPGSTYSHAFDTAGDYQYVSLPFESLGMTARVTVQG
jgi:plastocyanin